MPYARLKTEKSHPFYAGECDGGPRQPDPAGERT